MMRPIARAAMALLPIVAVPADVVAAETPPAVESTAECRRGPAEQPRSSELRVNPTSICPYGVEGLYRRLGTLLSDPGERLDIDEVRKQFGLPVLATSYDSDRIANYTVTVHGPDGWIMQLDASEARYPLDGKPAVFKHGIHPIRLVAVDTLDARYDIALQLPRGALSAGRCTSVQDAAAALEQAGWKDHTFFASASVTDGGHADPTYRAPRGGGSIVLGTGNSDDLAARKDRVSHCLTRLLIMQPPADGVDR